MKNLFKNVSEPNYRFLAQNNAAPELKVNNELVELGESTKKALNELKDYTDKQNLLKEGFTESLKKFAGNFSFDKAKFTLGKGVDLSTLAFACDRLAMDNYMTEKSIAENNFTKEDHQKKAININLGTLVQIYDKNGEMTQMTLQQANDVQAGALVSFKKLDNGKTVIVVNAPAGGNSSEKKAKVKKLQENISKVETVKEVKLIDNEKDLSSMIGGLPLGSGVKRFETPQEFEEVGVTVKNPRKISPQFYVNVMDGSKQLVKIVVDADGNVYKLHEKEGRFAKSQEFEYKNNKLQKIEKK